MIGVVTLDIKQKIIIRYLNVDVQRKILLKDKTKNSSSYRTLPLVPEIKVSLLEHKE